MRVLKIHDYGQGYPWLLHLVDNGKGCQSLCHIICDMCCVSKMVSTIRPTCCGIKSDVRYNNLGGVKLVHNPM
jgi:hypothetical protein